jgi:Mrp family chromosome partitioning ATPase
MAPHTDNRSVPVRTEGRIVGLFESLWRHRVALLLVVAVAAVGGYLVAARQPAVYKATTGLLFADTTSVPYDQSALLPQQEHSRYLATQADVATSRDVAAAAANVLGDGTPAADVQAALSAQAGDTSDTLWITATAGGAARAARLADAGASGYLTVLRDQARKGAAAAATRVQSHADDLQRQLDALSAKPATAANAAATTALQEQLKGLLVQLDQLRAAATDYEPAVRVVYAAGIPGRPVSPVPARDAGLAALLAMLVGAAVAWAFEARAQRRSDVGRFSRVLGTGCLGQVPAGDRSVDGVAPGERWQRVVSAVDASLRDVAGRCLLVTSPRAIGQESHVAASLASAVAEDGRSVVLVDADHGTRELSTIAGSGTAPGLTELVTGGEVRRGEGLTDGAGPTVALLAVGRRVANPAAFYRTASFRNTLAAVGERADLVLVLGPPVLEGAAAGVLADAVDAVVLVIPDSVSDADLLETRATLSWSSAGLLGYVVVAHAGRRTRTVGAAASLPDLVEPLRVVSGNGASGSLRPRLAEVPVGELPADERKRP